MTFKSPPNTTVEEAAPTLIFCDTPVNMFLFSSASVIICPFTFKSFPATTVEPLPPIVIDFPVVTAVNISLSSFTSANILGPFIVKLLPAIILLLLPPMVMLFDTTLVHNSLFSSASEVIFEFVCNSPFIITLFPPIVNSPV